MRISESCAECLYERQKNKTDNAEYLAEIKLERKNQKLIWKEKKRKYG